MNQAKLKSSILRERLMLVLALLIIVGTSVGTYFYGVSVGNARAEQHLTIITQNGKYIGYTIYPNKVPYYNFREVEVPEDGDLYIGPGFTTLSHDVTLNSLNVESESLTLGTTVTFGGGAR